MGGEMEDTLHIFYLHCYYYQEILCYLNFQIYLNFDLIYINITCTNIVGHKRIPVFFKNSGCNHSCNSLQELKQFYLKLTVLTAPQPVNVNVWLVEYPEWNDGIPHMQWPSLIKKLEIIQDQLK